MATEAMNRTTKLGGVVLLFAIVLLTSCTDKDERSAESITVDFNGNKTPRSEIEGYIQVRSLVPVKTEGLFLTSCNKAVVYDSLIYVSDQLQPMLFCINLNTMQMSLFLNKKGHAADEYISITDFDVDAMGNVYVFDSESQRINIYDSVGKFQRSMKATFGSSIAVSKKGEIALNCGHYNPENLAIIYSQEGKTLASIPQDKDAHRLKPGSRGTIAPFGRGYVFTTPYDYSLRTITHKGEGCLVHFNLGDATFDASQIEGMEYPEFQKLLMNSSDKIMFMDNLSVSDGIVSFSTNRGDYMLYDREKERVLRLSKAEYPYNVLFTSTPYIREGRFCVLLSGSNIKNALIPMLKKKPTGNPAIDGALKDENSNAELWLMLGNLVRP